MISSFRLIIRVPSVNVHDCMYSYTCTLYSILVDYIVEDSSLLHQHDSYYFKMSDYGSLNEIRDKIRRNVLQTEPKYAARNQIWTKFEAIVEVDASSAERRVLPYVSCCKCRHVLSYDSARGGTSHASSSPCRQLHIWILNRLHHLVPHM